MKKKVPRTMLKKEIENMFISNCSVFLNENIFNLIGV